MSEAHEMTRDEVRDRFLEHVCAMVTYWQEQTGQTPEARIEGMAFSILVALDGEASALPGFTVSPAPPDRDRPDAVREGRPYFPAAPVVECDIAGDLHDGFHETLARVRGEEP